MRFLKIMLLLSRALAEVNGLRDVGAFAQVSQSAVQPLTINFCRTWQGDEFICNKIFGHFCTYCVDPDAQRASERGICVTKKGQKTAERGAPCSLC